jgi:NitT/TauT family transport system substrate-binding protein
VDGQIWTGMDRGSFAKQGVDLTRAVHDRPRALQAMIGAASTCSPPVPCSQLPARGQGKAFLINDVEFATARLWVREDQGVKSFADEGQEDLDHDRHHRHVFLDTALSANGIDPTKDVELVNQRMAEAVTSFISAPCPRSRLGAVQHPRPRQGAGGEDAHRRLGLLPESHRRRLGDARRLLRKSYDVLPRIIRGWVEANDYIIGNPDAALEALQKNHYQQVPLRTSRAVQGAEDVPVERVAQDVRGRHGHQMASAGDGFLRAFWRHPEPDAGVEVLRDKPYLDTVKVCLRPLRGRHARSALQRDFRCAFS